jgi:hypothetical protein
MLPDHFLTSLNLLHKPDETISLIKIMTDVLIDIEGALTYSCLTVPCKFNTSPDIYLQVKL